MSLWPTAPNNHMDQSQRHRSSPLLSRHNRTREFELEISRADPKRLVAFDTQFLQQLRQLPDQLEQLKRHFDSGTKSTSRFEAWNDHAPYQQWNTREENLKREHEEKELKLKQRYKEQLRKVTESLQRENENLREQLENCEKVATEKDEEITALKRKVGELQQRVAMSDKLRKERERYSDGGAHELQKTRQALHEKERELERLKERHAAISERRVRSDQRKSENTLSNNRQSELESQYVTDFRDGARVDAVEVITDRARPYGTKPSGTDYLKFCRLACFIFEIAYECAMKAKTSFEKVTTAALDILSSNAPAIGLNKSEFQNKFRYMGTHNGDDNKSQDAFSEVMILVKEEAKTHDLKSLINVVKEVIKKKWIRDDDILPSYNYTVMYSLDEYINYCSKFAWCMVSQVPPLEIEYKKTVFNSRTHVLSQAFSFGGDNYPGHHRRHPKAQQTIMCYLWPTLQDCQGKVIVKGEVVLSMR